jgi:hypothetical protein
MPMRSLACLAILLSCSGCAVGVAGIAADILAGTSLASLTMSGKGLGDHAVSAASGRDCRVLEGMLRSDRAICEDYKLAGAVRPIMIETPPPPMPDMAAARPVRALPAIVRIEATAPPAIAAAPAKASPETGEEAAVAQAERPVAAAPENPAVVMEASDSLMVNFGGGRSDQAVLAQLHAAIAAWRLTDQPAPAAPPGPPDQPTEP